MNPTLSLLIPSRNRPRELSHLIQVIERTPSLDCEFIVSDNSDPSNIISYEGDRLSLIRPPAVLKMTDHWNFLLRHAQGKYITFLGDDDVFIGGALARLVSFLQEQNSDFVKTWTASYKWPQQGSSGHFFFVEPPRGADVSVSEIKNQVRNLKYASLPIPYNNAVFHRRLLDRFADEGLSGEFCSSRIPDVNAGAKIALLSQSSATYRGVVFVSGASTTSNGQLSRSNPAHPRAMEFSDVTHNPVFGGGGWLPEEPYPFGYATFFEALNESLFQLGERHRVREALLAFKLVFWSSNPNLQSEVMGRHFRKLALVRYLAMLLGTLRITISPLTNVAAYLELRLKCLVMRRVVVSYKGFFATSTETLSTFLEEKLAPEILPDN